MASVREKARLLQQGGQQNERSKSPPPMIKLVPDGPPKPAPKPKKPQPAPAKPEALPEAQKPAPRPQPAPRQPPKVNDPSREKQAKLNAHYSRMMDNDDDAFSTASEGDDDSDGDISRTRKKKMDAYFAQAVNDQAPVQQQRAKVEELKKAIGGAIVPQLPGQSRPKNTPAPAPKNALPRPGKLNHAQLFKNADGGSLDALEALMTRKSGGPGSAASPAIIPQSVAPMRPPSPPPSFPEGAPRPPTPPPPPPGFEVSGSPAPALLNPSKSMDRDELILALLQHAGQLIQAVNDAAFELAVRKRKIVSK